jgi:hypothetical protein
VVGGLPIDADEREQIDGQTYARPRDSVEFYDTRIGGWQVGPAWARTLWKPALAASCGGRLYVFGSGEYGAAGHLAEYARVSRFDPQTGTWATSP